jgi:hypothetical protein
MWDAIGVFVSAAAVLAGVGLTNWFNQRQRRMDIEARERESKEQHRQWFERTLFDRQLAVVNEAYRHLLVLNTCLVGLSDDPRSGEYGEPRMRLNEACRSARVV